MPRTRIALAVVATALSLGALSACADESAAGRATGAAGVGEGPRAAAGAFDEAANTAQQSETALAVDEVGDLGEVITDQDGFTLYRFDNDTADPPTTTCEDDCAEQWPPVLADGEAGDVSVQGVDEELVGTVTRPDGDEQVTVGGWPLYRYAEDTAAGQANGHEVGDVWFAANPSGGKAGQGDQPPADDSEGSGSEEGEESQDTAIVAEDIDGFGPALTDQDGRTLYLFTADSKDPSKTTCDGDCAEQWPPVTSEGDVRIEGVDESLIGEVERPDGTKQVTVGGWPVYRYSGDSAAGEVNGHGVGGKWFVIEPEGCKSEVPVDQGGDEGSSGY